jgi:hypothetical protein
MKKITLLLFVLLSFVGYSQNFPQDTNQVCFPYSTAKKIAKDLIALDSTKEILKLTNIELNETVKKVQYKDSIISTMVLKEQNYILLNEKEKEKFEIVQEQNKELRKEIRKMKVKNTIIQIFGGAVITTLTGVLIFK